MSRICATVRQGQSLVFQEINSSDYPVSLEQGNPVASLFNYASIPISSLSQSVGNTLVLSGGISVSPGDTATRPVQADSLIVQSLSGQVVNIPPTPTPTPTPTPIPTPEPTTLKPADLDLVAIAPVTPIKSTPGLSVEFRLLADFDMPRGLCFSWSRDKRG